MLGEPAPPFLIAPADPRSWGPWRLDLDGGELVCFVATARIVVPIATCTTAAAVVDWCVHLMARGWAEEPAIICGLLVAIDDILDLQSGVCDDGRRGRPGGTLNASDIAARMAAFVAGPDAVRHSVSIRRPPPTTRADDRT